MHGKQEGKPSNNDRAWHADLCMRILFIDVRVGAVKVRVAYLKKSPKTIYSKDSQEFLISN